MKPCTARKQRIVFIHTFWENKGALVRERRTRNLWWKVVPISRGHWLEIKTKTIFYCSYIQCNSFLYLPTLSFLARPCNKGTYKLIGESSPISTCARLTCERPVPAFHSHLDEFCLKQEAISSTEYTRVALCRLWAAGFHQPLQQIYSASVPMCNVAALTFMQLFMKICVVVVF